MTDALTMDGFHRALGEDRAGVLAVLQAGMDIGLDPDELAVIIERESGWNPRAVNPDGKARGLMSTQTEKLEDSSSFAPSRVRTSAWRPTR
jgi:soluble lytic murein transglycosylase-like protein